ncbi:MAG: hypothetical protein WA655_17400 [Candidatus Korobacteraceae bacterium]
MIQGRHSRKFYEYADRLLRDEVALSRLREKDAAAPAMLGELQLRIQNARAGMTSALAEVEA